MRDETVIAEGRFHTCDDPYVVDAEGILKRTEWTLELTDAKASFKLATTPVLEKKGTLRFYSAWETLHDIHDMPFSVGTGGHTLGVSCIYQEAILRSENRTA